MRGDLITPLLSYAPPRRTLRRTRPTRGLGRFLRIAGLQEDVGYLKRESRCSSRLGVPLGFC